MAKFDSKAFAYDAIAKYCLDDSREFGEYLYSGIRDNYPLEEIIHRYLCEYISQDEYEKIILKTVELCFDTEIEGMNDYRVINSVAEILIYVWGAHCVLTDGANISILNHRENMRMGFISLEECACKIIDEIEKTIHEPSVYIVDSVLGLVGLPSVVECLDKQKLFLSRK